MARSAQREGGLVLNGKNTLYQAQNTLILLLYLLQLGWMKRRGAQRNASPHS